MKEILKHIKSGEAFKELFPLIEGRVFHVTKDRNWLNIVVSGSLIPMPLTNRHVSSFRTRSYFREHSCVSLFDYRDVSNEKFKEHYGKCLPTLPLTEEDPIRILFLKPDYYNLLIPWNVWKTNGAGTNVVPYMEVGLEGVVPIEYFDEVMIVTITEDKNSLVYLLKSARNKYRHG